ncbi:MAG TPA: TIM barrel protein [Candidatus Lokiarchaeia archaeon]|nr:TIM barrel protein [Candidatus Lokiarchaeia archaeon]
MLIGITTEVFYSRPTALAEDITELLGFGMSALEIVPKSLADLQEASALRPLVNDLAHLSVLMPDPTKMAAENPPVEPEQVLRDCIQFATDLGASLFTMVPSFPEFTDPDDLIDALRPYQDAANGAGLTFAVLNSDAAASPAGNFESFCELVTNLQCKVTLELGHAYRAMPKQTAQLVGEHGEWIAAVHASDATEAFSYLPLGTGHVNYHMLIPIFQHNGFAGPFLIDMQHAVTKERIEASEFFLEAFE